MPKRKVTSKCEALAVLLRNEIGLSYRDFARKCKISKSTAHRICCYPSESGARKISRGKMGRPRKIDDRSRRILVRSLRNLRKRNINVRLKEIMQECSTSLVNVSERTVSHHLNKMGYGLYQAKKKGLLSESDRRIRLKYTRKMKRYFWTNEVSFYFDCVSFVYRRNPSKDALSPRAKVWRKRGEGLQITSKGSKDLPGGKRLHVAVAFAYGKRVILRVAYKHMNFFAHFVRNFFKTCFEKAGLKENNRRVFIMDNDPSQTRKAAKDALKEIKAEFHEIPACSPDLRVLLNRETGKQGYSNRNLELELEPEPGAVQIKFQESRFAESGFVQKVYFAGL